MKADGQTTDPKQKKSKIKHDGNGKTERELILEILMEVLEKGKFCQQVMNEVFKKGHLSRQEKAFITRTAQGTIEKKITIDYILNLYSKTKVEKMKPVVRNVMRSAVYQIFYMNQASDAAACNEAVKIISDRGMSGLKGFVNGVLRTISREKENIVFPDEEQDFIKALSVKFSMPEWLVSHFEQNYGKDKAKEILAGFSGERPITVRVNQRNCNITQAEESLKKDGVVTRRHPYCENALFLNKVDGIHYTEAFKKGWIQVQDASSILAVAEAGIEEGMKVLDVCAAPGGKSIYAADLTGEGGIVISRDISEKKVQLIIENKERCGFPQIMTEVADAGVYDQSKEGLADVVIADLPCSGLGVLSKKPDIKYRVKEEDFKSLENLQRKILDIVWRYVKPGGVLVYSTCTINPGENERMVEWFLKEPHPFRLESMRQLIPGELESDGFFMSKLRREL